MWVNKKILVFLFSIMVLSGSAQSGYITRSEVVESRNGHNYFVHEVEKGQTVYSIAKAYDVTVDEIYFENPSAKAGLSIGQHILIPTVNKETQLTTEVKESDYEFFYHIAAGGETFAHIATIYVIPENYIHKANPDLNSPLREGEYVKVPVEGSFEVLDGKRKVEEVKRIPTTYTPPPVSTAKPKPTTVSVNKPVTNKGRANQGQTKGTPNSSSVNPKSKKVRPTSEFVSFDPNIPVIADYRHVVIQGETTKSIAEKYDVPVDQLKATNPGLGNSVVKGDRLRVPDKTKIEQQARYDSVKKSEERVEDVGKNGANEQPVMPPVKPEKKQDELITHVVKKKETLYSIGRLYGVTVKDIQEVNPRLTTTISIGQVIKVPKKKITDNFIEHQVGSKIRTKNLAKLYQVDVRQLNDFNPALGKYAFTGQSVKIPVGKYAEIVKELPVEPEIVEELPPLEIIDEVELNNELCFKGKPHFDRIFHLALMLPLYLEELDSIDKAAFVQQQQPAFKSFRFMGFYEGALLALDSLKRLGLQVELHVYDVDQNLTKVAKVLQNPELRNMDLIVGPLFPSCYHQVALFAGNFDIPIVNPLTFRSKTATSYKTAIKVKPGDAFQSETLLGYIQHYYPQAKVFVITQNPYENATEVQEMLHVLRGGLPKETRVSNADLYNLAVGVSQREEEVNPDDPLPVFSFEGIDIYPDFLEQTLADSTTILNPVTRIVYMNDSLHPFLDHASSLRQNLVIVHGSTKSFVLDVMNRLNESRDTFDIKLVGMPNWERIPNISNAQLNNLETAYFSSDFIDYESAVNQDFVFNFRSEYSMEPDEYAYLGFDVTYYFMYHLFMFDDQFFNCLELNPMRLLQTTFQFTRSFQNSFENTYWNVLKYRNLQLNKIPDALLVPHSKEYKR